MSSPPRIGIDLGGTKIAGAALSGDGVVLASLHRPTPRNDYSGTLDAIAGIVAELERQIGETASVGVGIPGSISPETGTVQNANSTWLNGRPLEPDLRAKLERPLRIANDANCFALSEAIEGAGAGAHCVFGVILGTGCGGGLVIGQSLVDGPMSIGGEWGHNPLPWARADELPGPQCWCGRKGCIETWVSGPGLERDYAALGEHKVSAEEIAAASARGDTEALTCCQRHTDRLGRGLAALVNIIDPDVIVLGGGLSQMDHLYEDLPKAMERFVFSDSPAADIRPPQFGPASGVRGAARLWGGAPS